MFPEYFLAIYCTFIKWLMLVYTNLVDIIMIYTYLFIDGYFPGDFVIN